MMRKSCSKEPTPSPDPAKAENPLSLDQLWSSSQESAEEEEWSSSRPSPPEIFWSPVLTPSTESPSEEWTPHMSSQLQPKSLSTESTSTSTTLSSKAPEDTPRTSSRTPQSTDWRMLRLETNKTTNGELNSRMSKRLSTAAWSLTSRRLSTSEDIWRLDSPSPTPADPTTSSSDWILFKLQTIL